MTPAQLTARLDHEAHWKRGTKGPSPEGDVIRALVAENERLRALLREAVLALMDSHDANVSAKHYILKATGTTNPAREDAIKTASAVITKIRAALAPEGGDA